MANPLKARPIADELFSKFQELGFSQVAAYALRDTVVRSDKTLTDKGEVHNLAPVKGRTEGLGTTVQNVDTAGVVTANGADFSRAYLNKHLDNIPDGSTYARVKGTELALGAINQINSAYTDTSGGSLLSQVGITAVISIAGYTQRYSRGPVTYNADTVTAPSNTSVGYVYGFDPNYVGGPVPHSFTTDFSSIFLTPGNFIVGKITLLAGGGASGGGGGGGAGGVCFAPWVKVWTDKGPRYISDIAVGELVMTKRGMRKVRALLKRVYSGPLLDMGEGDGVTPEHTFVCGSREILAREVWAGSFLYDGPVHNLEIDTEDEAERNYILENGMLSHNWRPQGC